jgi:hypothetical protein
LQTALGATHDCSGMTGTALATCQQLNRNVNDRRRAGAGAGTISGMTAAHACELPASERSQTVARAVARAPSEELQRLADRCDALKALPRAETVSRPSTDVSDLAAQRRQAARQQ